MKFCSECGNTVSLKVPEDDNRPRFVCTSCGRIHYQNPRVIVGCLPLFIGTDAQTHGETVLLCRRGIEPRKGLWTLPAGFLENGETISQGAMRETREEANANTEIEGLYTVFSLPHISQAYMFFRARLQDLNFSAGTESLEVKLFTEAEIPWDELAFPVITETLQYYFTDRQSRVFPVHYNEIVIAARL